MTNIIFSFLSVILIIILIKYTINDEILLSDTGDKHQKFISKKKVPLIGGVIFLFSIIYIDIGLYLKVFSFLFFLLGLTSDLKILSSANTRFLLQCLLIVFCILLLDLDISSTRIQLLDQFLNNKIFNTVFVSFCIIIIVNGTNFIDGVNLNALSYYFLINLILLILSYEHQLPISSEGFIVLGISIFIISTFNFKNKLFLGDNGSYLMGFFYSIILIQFYDSNQNISPFFIILLLWYPAFENLFSILRKFINRKSPFIPDNLHMHHLIYLNFRSKVFLKNFHKVSPGIVINLFNLNIFYFGTKDISNSQNQIILIILSVIFYLIVYLKLYNKRLM